MCGKNRKFMLNAFQRQAASPVCGKNPSRNVICFPVTKVPVSTTVALYNRVLHDLHGRMSSGPPRPYFVETLRRGDNTAAGECCGITVSRRGTGDTAADMPSSEKESPIPTIRGDGTVCMA